MAPGDSSILNAARAKRTLGPSPSGRVNAGRSGPPPRGRLRDTPASVAHRTRPLGPSARLPAMLETARTPNHGSGVNHENGAHPSALRHAILLHLRQAGPSSPDQVAAGLAPRRTGVTGQAHP